MENQLILNLELAAINVLGVIKMAKLLIFISFLLLTFSSLNSQDNKKQERIIIERIKWLYQLKKQGKPSWPGYNSNYHEVVLAYFTNSTTYLVNPNNSLKDRLKLKSIYRDKMVGIYRSPKRIDSNEFHMETAYEDTDSTLLYYKNPVMMCSDYEITRKFVNDVNSLQKWASMVLHEYFHGFQFMHPSFLRYANDSIYISGTKLQSFYDSYKWYKDGVDQENSLLLTCLSSGNDSDVKSALKHLFALREKRRAVFQDSLHFDISKQEDFFEKMEGSARYMEWQVLKSFDKVPISQILNRIDTAYKADTYKNFHLESEPWMYEANSIRYFYSTGFNFLRLLDKFDIEYKRNFFNDKQLTSYNFLLKFIQN